MWTLSFAKEVLSQTTIVALKRTPVVGILFEGLGNALEKLQNENEAVCAAAREKSQEEVNRYLVTKINSLTQNDYPLLQIVKEFEGEVSDGGFRRKSGRSRLRLMKQMRDGRFGKSTVRCWPNWFCVITVTL
jgi:hypothetical protein